MRYSHHFTSLFICLIFSNLTTQIFSQNPYPFRAKNAESEYLYGLLNQNGEWIIKPEYYYINEPRYNRIKVSNGKAYALFDTDGNQLTDFCYSGIAMEHYYFHDNFIEVSNGKEYGAIDSNGIEIFPVEYEYLYHENSRNCTKYKVDGKFGLFDSTGKSSHFLNVVEGHGGGLSYHFRMMPEIYGWILTGLFVVSVIWIYIRKKWNTCINFVLMYIILVYLFYSVAASKMPAFTLIASIPVFLVIAIILQELSGVISSFIKKKWLAYFLLSAVTCGLCVNKRDGQNLLLYHSANPGNPYQNHYRKMKLHNTNVFIKLNSYFSDEKRPMVVFNCMYPNEVEIMFYTNFIAYPYIPSAEQINIVRQKGYLAAVFNRDLPKDLIENKDIILLQDSLIEQPK